MCSAQPASSLERAADSRCPKSNSATERRKFRPTLPRFAQSTKNKTSTGRRLDLFAPPAPPPGSPVVGLHLRLNAAVLHALQPLLCLRPSLPTPTSGTCPKTETALDSCSCFKRDLSGGWAELSLPPDECFHWSASCQA